MHVHIYGLFVQNINYNFDRCESDYTGDYCDEVLTKEPIISNTAMIIGVTVGCSLVVIAIIIAIIAIRHKKIKNKVKTQGKT